VPPSAETQGLTEKYIGSWMKAANRRREDIVLATKVGARMVCLVMLAVGIGVQSGGGAEGRQGTNTATEPWAVQRG
jgi:aryl-alcohol dehydrogenase-like predicted oxidoreductase